ncbi:MAG: Flavin reductase like domain-containing protein [uncultured Clostridium sp.]
MKEKVEFKGSVVLNPVPVVLITSKNKEGKENVFTVGWIGTSRHIEIQCF